MINFEKIDENRLMPFGKHKGRALKDVPSSYLLWLHKQGTNGFLEEYIIQNLDSITKEANEEQDRYNESKRNAGIGNSTNTYPEWD